MSSSDYLLGRKTIDPDRERQQSDSYIENLMRNPKATLSSLRKEYVKKRWNYRLREHKA